MTIADWCILGAVLIYLLTVAPVKAMGYRDFRNSAPRAPEFYAASPIRTRALGAHVNGIETFPFFAAAILVAEMKAAPQGLVNLLAVLFLAVRLAFITAYITDRPTVRTLLWNLGFFLNVGIFVSPLLRP